MAQRPIQQVFDQAVQHHQAARFAEAQMLYREIIARQPGNIAALQNLALILCDFGRSDEAVTLARRAVQLQPKFTEAHNTLSNALRLTGHLDEAIAAAQSAIALRPDYAEAYNNLASALLAQGKLSEAIIAYRQAIALRPDMAEIYSNLGDALKEAGQLDAAISSCRKAIALRPDLPEAYNNLGNALQENGEFDASNAAYRQAIALRPSYASAHSNLVYSFQFRPEHDGRAIAEAHRQWNLQHAEPLRQSIRKHTNSRDPERRLRIGYVSSDFRDHVIGRNMLPLFQQQDRAHFQITCYTQVVQPDAITRRFQQLADGWRNIAGISDERAAELIRQDGIDILVDLTLHLARNRLLIFARKPAPVQVTFAGYPGSTGLTAIDYRLSDPYLDPPEMDESIYSEKTIRLPDSFWCFDPLEDTDLSPSTLPATKNGFVTFGCLNNFLKINESALGVWARVLRNVPNSRLLLLAKQGTHRQQAINVLGHAGINPSRIEFASIQPRRAYLELYHRIDICLDSFPYNGHTTSLDSFWMGVPVVTLVGQTAVGRAGWCQLSNLGLTELAANTPEQFVEVAVQLANDLPRLSQLRSILRSRMEESPLMDAPKFARNIETAYRQMWRTWCETPAGNR